VLFNDLPSYSNLALPSRLLGVSFIIALLLACMGLYGLASFNAEIRTKEIGIRKTNGASTFKVMIMLTSDYLKWLLIALGFAAPVAFFLGRIFLSGFYFHSNMPVFAFITGPLIAFVVALLTVSIKTFRVANRNPVEALRYE
jgi:putative ABC transport system permease protein